MIAWASGGDKSGGPEKVIKACGCAHGSRRRVSHCALSLSFISFRLETTIDSWLSFAACWRAIPLGSQVSSVFPTSQPFAAFAAFIGVLNCNFPRLQCSSQA